MATVKLILKYFFSKSRSLSIPAKNISMITPMSEKRVIVSLGWIQPKRAGPSRIPDKSWPMTGGQLKRAKTCPSRVVISKTSISCPINFILTSVSKKGWKAKNSQEKAS